MSAPSKINSPKGCYEDSPTRHPESSSNSVRGISDKFVANPVVEANFSKHEAASSEKDRATVNTDKKTASVFNEKKTVLSKSHSVHVGRPTCREETVVRPYRPGSSSRTPTWAEIALATKKGIKAPDSAYSSASGGKESFTSDSSEKALSKSHSVHVDTPTCREETVVRPYRPSNSSRTPTWAEIALATKKGIKAPDSAYSSASGGKESFTSDSSEKPLSKSHSVHVGTPTCREETVVRPYRPSSSSRTPTWAEIAIAKKGTKAPDSAYGSASRSEEFCILDNNENTEVLGLGREKLAAAALSTYKRPDYLQAKRGYTLLVGEGNFSFCQVWVDKREKGKGIKGAFSDPHFARKVVATEFKSEQATREIEGVAERIQSLVDKGVTVLYSIDASRLTRISFFRNRQFSRIQWNCPDLGLPSFHEACSGLLANTIQKFLINCAVYQPVGGRVHITFLAPPNKEPFISRERTYKHYMGLHYRIASCLKETKYDLYKIKESGSERYSEDRETVSYQHQKTNGQKKVENAEYLKEYIFVKLPDGVQPRYLSLLERIEGTVATGGLEVPKGSTHMQGQYIPYEKVGEIEELSSDEEEPDVW